MRLANLDKDLMIGHEGETIVKQILNQSAVGYTVHDSDNQNKGDLIAVDWYGQRTYIEVKNDSCIATTGNVLCEETVYYDDTATWKPGFMYNESEVFAVLSQADRKIYFIDFKVLQSIYKRFPGREMRKAADQLSYVYLVPIGNIKKHNGLLGVISY